jgi:hypothetical protein
MGDEGFLYRRLRNIACMAADVLAMCAASMYRKAIRASSSRTFPQGDLAKDSRNGVFSVMASHPTASVSGARNKDARNFPFKRTGRSNFSTFIIIDFEFSMTTC